MNSYRIKRSIFRLNFFKLRNRRDVCFGTCGVSGPGTWCVTDGHRRWEWWSSDLTRSVASRGPHPGGARESVARPQPWESVLGKGKRSGGWGCLRIQPIVLTNMCTSLKDLTAPTNLRQNTTLPVFSGGHDEDVLVFLNRLDRLLAIYPNVTPEQKLFYLKK